MYVKVVVPSVTAGAVSGVDVLLSPVVSHVVRVAEPDPPMSSR